MTGTAEPPLHEFGDAHAELIGPTHRPGATTALAKVINAFGIFEQYPEGPTV